jgi:hypothetical protein
MLITSVTYAHNKQTMNKVFFFGALITSLHSYGGVEKQITKKEYVEQWRNTSVQQMIQFKIPASITMAQAILESGSGNSVLAREGNNHFGIKCHDWEGKTIYLDDDKKGECFRVYDSADESYIDHSEFLTTKSRYSKLFSLELTDYKSWAHGLKEAGYATNPKYPELLIGIIEDLKLNELDMLGIQNNEISPLAVETNNTASTSSKASTAHQVFDHQNKVKYVVARKGDTFYRISKEFGVALWQLYNYNDFGNKKDVLEEGDIVYIQPKRRRSKVKEVVLSKEITVKELSQLYAMKPEAIVKKNNFSSIDQILPKGEKVYLR